MGSKDKIQKQEPQIDSLSIRIDNPQNKALEEQEELYIYSSPDSWRIVTPSVNK